MTAAIATLLLGLVVGYLGQRSRLCFVSGYRDWVLTRDTRLLKGVAGTFGGAIAGYALFGALGGIVPAFPLALNTPVPGDATLWAVTILGGLGTGVVGALAGGCPFRMHVLAAEGRVTNLYYLAGFYVSIVFFNEVTAPFLASLGMTL